MAGSLDDYRKKRDFARTPEPKPGADADPAAESLFVVHRHEARSLHYDLRLQVGGVLRSWAVPRGFSYDPSEKRLAVQTEDHPLEYQDFSGRIPKGEYGAGTMTIWDRGFYELVKVADWPTAMEKGEVKVRLRGRRLRGEWHLVKTKRGKNQWLLFKSNDRYAGPARDTLVGVDLGAAREVSLPRRLQPMRWLGEVEPFSDPEWLFEMEFVGRRALCRVDRESLRLAGLKAEWPELTSAMRSLRGERAVIDGVLVALDAGERPDRSLLEHKLETGDWGDVHYYAFDLPFYEDYDLRTLPLLDRKAALRAILPHSSAILFVDHVAGSGERLVEAVAAAGLPGVIAKRATSSYRTGARDDWRRIPVRTTSDIREQPVTDTLARSRTSIPSRVRMSNLDKVYWPAAGYTKGDLLAYYGQVADHLLPHLHERPVHLNRFPDGIDGKSFYQRQAPEGIPDWIDTVMIHSSHDDEGPVRQMLCNDRDALLWMVNTGSIELHPWLSRRGSLDCPDYVVLDLDAKESPFSDVVKIARVAGRLLRGIGLRPHLKTSGKSGLHVYVPLQPGFTYEHARMFCEGVARAVYRELPDIATVERKPSGRGGRVYLDFLQNRRGQTIVPPYVVRPVPGAHVSMPLLWDELDGELHPSAFTIHTALPRLVEHGDLFRGVLTDLQDLLPAVEELQQHLREG